MKISSNQIISSVKRLGIRTADHPNSGGWLSILCRYHDDENLGSGYINLDSSVFHCFACGADSNLVSLVIKELNCDYKSALKFIGIEHSIPYEGRRQYREDKAETLRLLGLPPREKFTDFPRYMMDRGFTHEFCDHFDIQKCISGFFRGFMIIPLPEARTFEARKIYEDITIQKLLSTSETNLTVLRDSYHAWRKAHRSVKTEITEYLDKGKTLYPSRTLIDKKIIFNLNRLDKDQDLYITEGIAGIPKIWTHLSRNVTATLGSEVSETQIRILRSFRKKKIIIPEEKSDRNQLKASQKLIINILTQVEGTHVIPVNCPDTSERFVEEIQKAQKDILPASLYIVRERKIFS